MNKKITMVLAALLLMTGCTSASSEQAVPAGSEKEPEAEVKHTTGDAVVRPEGLSESEFQPDVLLGTWIMESVSTSDGYMLNDFTDEIGEISIHEDWTADFLYRAGHGDQVNEEGLNVVFRKGTIYLSSNNQEWYAQLEDRKGTVVCSVVPEDGKLFVTMPKDAGGEKIDADYYYTKSAGMDESVLKNFPDAVQNAMKKGSEDAALLLWMNPEKSVQKWAGDPVVLEKGASDTVLMIAMQDNVCFDIETGTVSSEGYWDDSDSEVMGTYNLGVGEWLWLSFTVPEGIPTHCIRFSMLGGEGVYPLQHNLENGDIPMIIGVQ